MGALPRTHTAHTPGPTGQLHWSVSSHLGTALVPYSMAYHALPAEQHSACQHVQHSAPIMWDFGQCGRDDDEQV